MTLVCLPPLCTPLMVGATIIFISGLVLTMPLHSLVLELSFRSRFYPQAVSHYMVGVKKTVHDRAFP
jgi:hypothetical protein